MMPTLDSVLADAMQLERDDRELLATRLATSLEKDPVYDEAWAAEIARRRDALAADDREALSIEDFDRAAWGDMADLQSSR